MLTREFLLSLLYPAGVAWLEQIVGMRRRTREGQRDPSRALLLLFALGRLQRKGFEPLWFREIEEPLAALLHEFGPPWPAGPGHPFHHLVTDGMWEVGTASGATSPGPDAGALRASDAVGRLLPSLAEDLLADSALFAQVVRSLLDVNFEPSLHWDVCANTGLMPEVAETGPLARYLDGPVQGARRGTTLRQQVLVTYDCRCAFCGYEGWIGNTVVGLQAARLRWWAFDGRDEPGNALCLCTLHHRLLDRGVLGLTPGGIILVSRHFAGSTGTARNLVLALAGRPAARPHGGFPPPDPRNIEWHGRNVFRGPARIA